MKDNVADEMQIVASRNAEFNDDGTIKNVDYYIHITGEYNNTKIELVKHMNLKEAKETYQFYKKCKSKYKNESSFLSDEFPKEIK
jgi:hypothetical protein